MVRRNCLSLVLLACAVVSCSRLTAPPPNLTPQASIAWKGTQVIHAIDVIRDIAQDGTKTTPPVIAVADATKITTWHRAALDTIHATPAGWEKAVEQGLTSTLASLPSTSRSQLQPYVQLAITVLHEVTK